eukprot:gene1939-1177_t
MLCAATRPLRVTGGFSVHRDTQKTPRLVKETGQWLYQPATTRAFQQWCRDEDVRAYGSIKMTTTPHFARCLRATRRIAPAGRQSSHAPIAAYEEPTASSGFPLPLSWSNYNDRLAFLKSTTVSELATAGWMVRIASLENSRYTPYMHFLLEDTRGRDGIAHGLSKEREDDSGMVDHYFSELATDAGEDPDIFLEHLFRSFACIHLRTQPIEAEAIRVYVPGTNFFKVKAKDMYVPTLMPLVDCVPQVEDDTHNTVVQYFPFPAGTTAAREAKLLEMAEELRIPMRGGSSGAPPRAPVGSETKEQDMFRMEKLEGGGLFALRAIRPIEPGDVLYLRHFPAEGDAAQHGMNANVIEANRLLSHDN